MGEDERAGLREKEALKAEIRRQLISVGISGETIDRMEGLRRQEREIRDALEEKIKALREEAEDKCRQTQAEFLELEKMAREKVVAKKRELGFGDLADVNPYICPLGQRRQIDAIWNSIRNTPAGEALTVANQFAGDAIEPLDMIVEKEARRRK